MEITVRAVAAGSQGQRMRALVTNEMGMLIVLIVVVTVYISLSKLVLLYSQRGCFCIEHKLYLKKQEQKPNKGVDVWLSS